MTLNSVRDELFPAHYNHFLMDWRRRQLGLSIREIARLMHGRPDTITDVFRGRASSKTVYPIARLLGLDWAMVHRLTLSEEDYPLAVHAGIPQGAHLIAPQEAVSNSTPGAI